MQNAMFERKNYSDSIQYTGMLFSAELTNDFLANSKLFTFYGTKIGNWEIMFYLSKFM